MKAFLDTYAMLEIMQGNADFAPFLRNGVTTHFNLLEFHVHACRLRDADAADAAFGRLRSKAIATELEDVLEASRFKRANGRKNISFADALGYAMAQRRRIPFATGDRAFKGLPGVVP